VGSIESPRGNVEPRKSWLGRVWVRSGKCEKGRGFGNREVGESRRQKGGDRAMSGSRCDGAKLIWKSWRRRGRSTSQKELKEVVEGRGRKKVLVVTFTTGRSGKSRAAGVIKRGIQAIHRIAQNLTGEVNEHSKVVKEDEGGA